MTQLDLGPRYTVIRELGSGGMGRVLLVRDAFLRRKLALKHLHAVLPAAAGTQGIAPEAIERARREFALLAEINHPGVAKAYDFGWAGGVPYFTTEFVEGPSLAAHAPATDLTRFTTVASGLVEAAASLHTSGILHLDIKPSNIMLRGHGARLEPVLIDFGLVRRGLTTPPGAALLGSLPYMAPEYFRGLAIGPWTDVYALGVTLYRLLSGCLPRWEALAGDRCALADACASSSWEAAPRAPRSGTFDVTSALANVVLRCLALDASHRYRSAVELARDLAAALGRSEHRIEVRASATTVGRDAELGAIDAFLDGVAAQPPRRAVLVMTGARGMGQSHLMRQLKLRAQARGLRVYLEAAYPGRSSAPGALLRCLGTHLVEARGEEVAALERWERFVERLARPRPRGHDETLDDERRMRRAIEVTRAARSVREPLVLAIDGLQYADEISLELVGALTRFLAERDVDAEAAARPPIALVLGYREEDPSATRLREISGLALHSDRCSVLALRPLDVSDTSRLFAEHGGSCAPGGELALFEATEGCPARVIAHVARSQRQRGVAAPSDPARVTPSRPHEAKAGAGGECDELAIVLALLGRPAGLEEAAALAALDVNAASEALARATSLGLAEEIEASEGEHAWIATTAAVERLSSRNPARLRELRRGLADSIAGGAEDDGDPALAEAVRHYDAAGDAAKVVELGVRAARFLKSTYQNRAALEMLRLVHRGLPARRAALRVDVALDMADLCARTGDVDEGILVLREELVRGRAGSELRRARLVLRLAALHARRGDLRRADTLFEEGLDVCRSHRERRRVDLAEFLVFLNEQAAVKVFLGDLDGAERLCDEGTALSRRSRRAAVREVFLNLHATRANLAVRRFDHEGAATILQEALRIAESLGALGSQAVVLNNLGKVYSQLDRYTEAAAVFEEAERLSIRIDEGPSLAAILGNLAVLHAKLGDAGQMSRALAEAERLASGVIGRREAFFLAHAAGLARLSEGRPAPALAHFDDAIRIGAELGERHVVVFDRVYRAEAMLLTGRLDDAERELVELEPDAPTPARGMSLARRALAAALACRDDDAADLCETRVAMGHLGIHFVEAWDRVLLGWACSRAGLAGAVANFEEAGVFFERTGLAPARELARLLEVEARFLDGDAAGAARLLESARSGPGSSHGLAAVLAPLLSARLALEPAAGSGASRVATPTIERDEGLLTESAAALVGADVPLWALLVEALRAWLGGETRGAFARDGVSDALARAVPSAAHDRFLRARYWSRWFGDLPERPHSAQRSSTRHGSRGHGGSPEGPPAESSDGDAATETLGRRQGPLRARLVARSESMRRLAAELDRLRPTEFPVLVRGETGAGKELVARVIHEESPRAAGPFLVVDCATIPESLLEVELFGAVAGAFTDQTADRRGLLELACGGTVLVDEVAGVSLEVQAKLLRVFSEGTVRPVGGEAESRIDARFIFATARDLDVEVREERFRRDLLHRINAVLVDVPPLRERTADIEELVESFLREESGARPHITPGAFDRLRELKWPGNVRELRNLFLRLRLRGGSRIDVAAIDQVLDADATRSLFPENVLARESLAALHDRLEREYVLFHLRRLSGDTEALQDMLGLRRRQLYNRCKRLGIVLREEKRRIRGGALPPTE